MAKVKKRAAVKRHPKRWLGGEIGEQANQFVVTKRTDDGRELRSNADKGKYPGVPALGVYALMADLEAECHVRLADRSNMQMLPQAVTEALRQIPDIDSDSPDRRRVRIRGYLQNRIPSITLFPMGEEDVGADSPKLTPEEKATLRALIHGRWPQKNNRGIVEDFARLAAPATVTERTVRRYREEMITNGALDDPET